MKDNFKDKAGNWDKGDIQVNGARKIADAITKKIKLTNEMNVLDFGVGTGLLGFEIAKSVKKVYGVDMSPSMLKKLEEKNTPQLHIEAVCQDIIKEPLTQIFNGLVSSMTLHHVENLERFFASIYKNINDDGFIAIADLESEDGTFHTDNTGVYHLGFDENKLCQIVKDAGFKDITFEHINTLIKPEKKFRVFLLTATKA